MPHAATSPPRPTPRSLPESGRVEAFSDGVFAIALTLLVLDLAVPDSRGDFAHELGRQWQSYVAYVGAFLTIASVWINHHDLFTRVRGVNPKLMVVNLGLLLTSSVIPFPTAVLSSAMRDGDRHDQVVASVLYAGIGLLMALSWTVLYGYLEREPKLLVEPSDARYMHGGLRRTMISIVAFPVGAALAFVEPTISLIAYAALPFFFMAAVLYAKED
jgi:uncharacterized membrane protein